MTLRFLTLACLASLAQGTPAMAQETAQQVYDAYVAAYTDGQSIDAYPEYLANLTLEDHIGSILKDDPELKGWADTDTSTAVAAFGAPIRAPYKLRVTGRLIGTLSIADAKAATALAADPAALKTINCVAGKPSRAASEWAACAADGGRAFTAEEQALGTRAITAVNQALASPDLNSAVVGIVCHTLDRFSDRVSTEEMTRKYSMTVTVISAEPPLACDRARPRYAALAGHDAYLKLEPSLIFDSARKGE